MKNKINFVFFGTSEFSVTILEKLKETGLVPSLVVTREDKPQGRHLVLTPPPVKVWALTNNINFLQPTRLKDPELLNKLSVVGCELFIVASYGRIIPQNILDIPTRGTLNVHPSLLPKLRGPSPIQGAILEEERTGVTIILLDSEMDHGPILAQKEISPENWPPYAENLENTLAEVGGTLLAEVIHLWVEGKITAKEQDHTKATYTKKIQKEDAEINLEDKPELNLKKICAYAGWPNAFTYFKHKGKDVRVVIKKASLSNGELVIERVVPEGKKEMSFEEFKKGLIDN